jgi:hypothetical protein
MCPNVKLEIIGGLSSGRGGGLAHGNRERKPINRLPDELRQRVIELAGEKYRGFNHTHLTEKLVDCEQIHLSRSRSEAYCSKMGYPVLARDGHLNIAAAENVIPKKACYCRPMVAIMIG